MRRRRMTFAIGAGLATAALGAAVTVMAQGHQGHGAAAPAKPPRAISMDELHRGGGVPRGWKFTLPQGGDPGRGRQLFADLECYKCHAIQGAGFPPLGTDGKTGPELTGMGAHHPAEYFAESILAPDNVLLAGPGWIGPDGRSIMPSYADSLTMTQLVDLVAFIKRQDAGHSTAQAVKDGSATQAHHHAAHERAVGPYRVRLVFKPAASKSGGDAHHGAHGQHSAQAHHGHHGQHGSDAPAGAAGHLMAFVSDATTGDAVPYLPVSAGIQARGAPARTLKLVPMMGDGGFHYGANATLPSGTQKVVLTIGAPTMPVMGADRGRFAGTRTVSFDWSSPAK